MAPSPDPQAPETHTNTNTTTPTPTTASDPQEPGSSTGFIAVIGSVLAALFGIQSNAKRQRDFKKGDAADFIVVAIVGAVLLVLGMILLVNHVLSE